MALLLVSALLTIPTTEPIGAATISVSGTIYTDEGVTALDCSTSKTVALSVNGGAATTVECSNSPSNGSYSFSNVSVNSGDLVTLYLDNETAEATTVYVSDATTQSNVDLYQNWVIVRADTGSITNGNLATADNGDDDIKYSALTNVTFDSGFSVHVWTGDTYAPGGTVSVTGGADLHIATSATLNMAGNALTLYGSYDNDGTFTHGNNTIYLYSTSTGETISGNLTGSSAWYKFVVNGSGGEWTVTDSMDVTAADASDMIFIRNGTFIFGDSDGDTLTLEGRVNIATTANENGTFKSGAVAEGSTVTIDLNKNTSTPNCGQCFFYIGASSGTGQGTLEIQKNTVLRLNPRSAATASDTGIWVEDTGYLYVHGSQDDTGTSDGTTNETTLTDTSKSWTADQHNNKKVRITNTSSLAFGMVYTITDTTATTLVRADTSSVDSTVQSISTGTTYFKDVCSNSTAMITANDEGVGRYLHDATGTTGYLLIVDSTNDDTSCTTTADSFRVIADPGALSILATSDTIDVSDGVRAGDTFEILDYAYVTAEAGTACNATLNEAGEAYIYSTANSETLIQYAEICNMGRNTGNKYGVYAATIDADDANEGYKIDTSEIHDNYYFYLNAIYDNTEANSAGIIDNQIYNQSLYGLYLYNGDRNDINRNRVHDNSNLGIFNWLSADENIYTQNYVYSNSSYGMRIRARDLTLTSNRFYSNPSYNLYMNEGDDNDFNSNYFMGKASYGVYTSNSQNNTYDSNTFSGMTYGAYFGGNDTNNVISKNKFIGNSARGLVMYNNNYNAYIFGNTVADNGNRGINIQQSPDFIMFSNTVANNDITTAGAAFYIESNGTASNGILHSNTVDADYDALFLQYATPSTITLINENYGSTTANTRDIRWDQGDHDLYSYGSVWASTEIHAGPSASGSFIIAKKHDNVDGKTRVWGEYTIQADNTETPQDESKEQYNYADALWPDSITEPTYNVGWGAGTEDTDLSLGFSGGSLGGNAAAYAYRIYCSVANCVTTANGWIVYREGTNIGTASTGTQFTDATTNVQFTIQDAGTDYTQGATYQFVAYRGSGDVNTQKEIKMMQDGDVFTAPAGTTLELKGQNATTNPTQVTRDVSGGYQFVIGGTIDADGYEFDYLGGTAQASGLDINAGATVTSLDNGDFDNFATNVGTADSFIDVDSSVIGSGTPSLTIQNTVFANTGSNANCNVNATGTDATGHWHFVGSTGTFGGEGNDCNDGVADPDPGQVKWGGAIIVSGTVYSDEGTTAYDCSANNLTIGLVPNGGTTETTTCTAADGTFSFNTAQPAAAGEPYVVFIDSTETPKATTATLTADTTSFITGLDLYQNRTIVRSESATAMTNALLSSGDNADAGIRYAVSGGNLTVESGLELHVWTGDTFAPGGTVTTGAGDDVHIASTATLNAAGNAVTVGGSWDNDGTYTPGANTTTFNASSGTETIDSTGAASAAFNHLTLNDGVGNATFSLSSALDVDGNLTITGGTLATNSKSVNVGGNFDNDDTITIGTSTLTFDATSGTKTIDADGTGTDALYNVTFNDGGGSATFQLTTLLDVDGNLTITGGTLDANGNNLTVGGNWDNDDTFTAGGALVTFDATSGTKTIDADGTGSEAFYDLTFNDGGGSATFQLTTLLDVDNDLTITGGTLDANGSNTITVGGSWTNSDTFTASTSTVVLDSIQATETITSGGSAFYNLELDSGLVGYWKFDEGTGTTSVNDSSRYGQAGTMTNFESGDWNTAVNNVADFGNNPSALDFDGATTNEEYINLGTPNQLNSGFTDEITLAAFVRPLATTKLEAIIGKPHNDAKDSPYYKWLLYRTSNNALSIRVDSTFIDSSASTLTNNVWQHVAGTYDGSNIRTYKNGVQVAVASKTGNIQSSSSDACIGAGCGTSITGEWTGRIDDVRIYKRALSATELAALSNGNHPTVTTFTLQDALDVNGDLGVRTGELDVSATNCSAAPCPITVAGDYVNVANFNPRTGTVTFDGTASGKTIQADESFYNLTVNGSGGAWTLDRQRLDVDNDLTIAAGTLDASASSCSAGTSCAMEIGGSFTNRGAFVSQTNTVTLNATSGTETIDFSEADSAAGADFHSLTFNDGGGSATYRTKYDLDLAGNLTITGGTLDLTGPTTYYLTSSTDSAAAGNRRLQLTDPAGAASDTAACSDNTIDQSGKYCVFTPTGTTTNWSASEPSTIQQTGWMLNDGAPLSGTFAAGSWTSDVTVNISEGRYDYGSYNVCGRLWKANATLTSSTAISNWTCASAVTTTGVSDRTITFNSVAAQTLSDEVLYVEYYVRMTGLVIDTGSGGATTVAFRVNEGGTKQQVDSPAFTPQINVAGDWTNGDTFTHQNGSVVFDGTATQTLSGTMTGASAFSTLELTNTSGAVSGCSTSFTPGIDFAAAATATNYTITTGGVKVEYNSGSTYTFTNVNWNGQSISTPIVFRNSSLASGSWALNVSGTQTAVNAVDVGRSNASSGNEIIANSATNTDCENNVNWKFRDSLTLLVNDTTMGLGVLNPSAVGSDSHTITVTSTAANGYTCKAVEDGELRDASGNDVNEVSDGTVSAGSEEYGISCSGADCQLTGDNALSATPLTVASNTGTVSASATTLTYKASASTTTPGTAYSQTVTITCTADF